MADWFAVVIPKMEEQLSSLKGRAYYFESKIIRAGTAMADWLAIVSEIQPVVVMICVLLVDFQDG